MQPHEKVDHSQHQPHIRRRRERVFSFVETPEVFIRRPELISQIDNQLNPLFELTGRTDREKDLIRGIFNGYMVTRYDRGKEITSKDVETARNSAQLYFSEEVGDEVLVMTEFCMDRRVRKALVLGLPARMGKAFRSPGANPADFKRVGFGSKLTLEQESEYALEIDRLTDKYRYILGIEDSHYNCKRGLDTQARKFGTASVDKAVIADRRYKREMIQAVRDYTQGKDTNFTFIQTSFDPHTGFLDYFGEENPENVLLSTRNLAYGSLEEVFKKHQFNIDWLDNYGQSASHFWKNIMQMRNEALPSVRDILRDVDPNLERNDPVKFGMMSRVALLSAYSGWLNNLSGSYPHDYHNEDSIVASAGGEFGPYPNFEAFEIALNSPELPSEAEYASGLIRDFRREGNAYGEVTDPVPFIIQSRVSNLRSDNVQSVIDLISRVGIDIRNHKWTEMSYERLFKYLENLSKAEGIDASINFGNSFADLVMKNALIFNPKHSFASLVYEGHVIPLSLFVDDNGSPLGVLPLIPRGQ